MANPSFWKGKKVLITGHTGFKGSWLSLWLQHLGASVIGYALDPPTRPSLFDLSRISEHMTSIRGDIRSLTDLKKAFDENTPEIVIHMAAQSIVRLSYETPVDTFSVNIMGTVNILEAVRSSPGVKVLIVVTSDKCYENREWPWGYREVDSLGGVDPYSCSKGCAEMVTAAYRYSFFSSKNIQTAKTAVASVRAGNVIGGGDWAMDRLVPDIIRSFLEKKPAIIRNPTAIRPWQHVLEPLSGYLLLAENLWIDPKKYEGPWNFGPSEETSKNVSSIVADLAKLWGSDASWKEDTGKHAHEFGLLKLDSSKARSWLGWGPRLPLFDTLKWIVEWYREFQNNGCIRSLTLNQISRYENHNWGAQN